MPSLTSALLFAGSALAAQPWLNEADTGFETYLKNTSWTEGTLPNLKDIRALPDFNFAARQVLVDSTYGYYRDAAGQEWSYRNNLDVWSKVQFRPRFFQHDASKLNDSLGIELFGYNFSLPVFIAPASGGGRANPERAELNFMEATGDNDMLYVAALYATRSIEDLAAVKRNNTANGPQVSFQQLYTQDNLSATWDVIRRAEEANAKAIVWTIDSPGDSIEIRPLRYSGDDWLDAATRPNSWDVLSEMKNRTKLPIILKGIQSVEDAVEAVARGADGLYVSNHGGRQLEYSPSPLEILYEIRKYAPEIFDQVPVIADSGVRSGSDILKLMSLGAKAVGLGRSFHFSNVYGYDGVAHAIRILRNEILQDGWNLGISSLSDLNPGLLNLRQLEAEVRQLTKDASGSFVQAGL